VLKRRFELFLDTDVLRHNLFLNDKSGIVNKCKEMFECFTSVINAAELLEDCNTKTEIEMAKKSFSDINILGIPFRYSLGISETVKKIKANKLRINFRDAVVMSLCIQARLPVLALNEKKYLKYSDIVGLQLINKKLILHNSSSEEILRKAKIL